MCVHWIFINFVTIFHPNNVNNCGNKDFMQSISKCSVSWTSLYTRTMIISSLLLVTCFKISFIHPFCLLFSWTLLLLWVCCFDTETQMNSDPQMYICNYHTDDSHFHDWIKVHKHHYFQQHLQSQNKFTAYKLPLFLKLLFLFHSFLKDKIFKSVLLEIILILQLFPRWDLSWLSILVE